MSDTNSTTFYASPRHGRRLLIAGATSLLLAAASFPLEWPLAISGGLLGTAVGLALSARKEFARGPLLEVTPEAVIYRGNLIARWLDIERLDHTHHEDRHGRVRHCLGLREYARGDAMPEFHKLDLTDLDAPSWDKMLDITMRRWLRSRELKGTGPDA